MYKVDSQIQEKLMELVMEKEEKAKTIELLKQIRERDLKAAQENMHKLKQEKSKDEEELKNRLT